MRKYIGILEKFFKQNVLFVVLILIMILLEITFFNHQFFYTTLQGLQEQQFSITDGSLNGFQYLNGQLIAENEDPNITLDQIHNRIRYITIRCTNTNPDALSQIFYRRDGEGWTEENSVIFPLINNETTISLPNTRKIAGLRLDLTNKEGDILSCEGFTINPKATLNFSYLRMILFIFCLMGLIFGYKVIPQKLSDAIWELLIKDGIWVFILILILINFHYPVTIAFDSAHYLWLADLIKTGDWVSWDPFRSIVFPLHLSLSLSKFGYNQNTLLLPMVLAHILLFTFSCQIAFEIIQPKSRRSRVIIILTIFLFIALDPTIFGYFHTLLTEYAVATIATISSYVALKLYKAPLFSKRFYTLSLYFLFFAPITWHIKQPYIGAAYFPFILVCLVIILREFSWKILIFSLIANLLIFAVVLASTQAWNIFLESQGNPMREERHIFLQLEDSVSRESIALYEQPSGFLSNQLSKYFTSINFKPRPDEGFDTKYSLTYGFQNNLIAHRMFLERGKTNLYYHHPSFDTFTKYFIINYAPPRLPTLLFQMRLTLSHVLFTVTYLLLPLSFVIGLVVWIREKKFTTAALIILAGTSLFNALAHLLIWPIDRYLFLGYPLNLLALLLLIILAILKLPFIRKI